MSGGSIAAEDILQISGSEFSKNFAPTGGAISWLPLLINNSSFVNCTWNNNEADNGSAIYVAAVLPSPLFLSNCVFRANTGN